MKSEDGVLAAQQERLDRLRKQSAEVRALRERECEIEIECISAEAALNASSREGIPDIDPDAAEQLAEALHGKRRLEAARDRGGGARGPDQDTRELVRLAGGRDSLRTWLEAPVAARRQSWLPVVRTALFLLVVTVAWAAITVHPVLLVLLIPMALVSGFLRQSSQNLSWLRLGAERRFGGTGLRPPAAWDASAVKTRLSEIEDDLHRLSQAMEEDGEMDEAEEVDEEALQSEIVQAEARLNCLLAGAGMTTGNVPGEFERWLALVRRRRQARKALQKVQAARAAASAETERGRDELFRFLSRHGQTPPEGRADVDALAAGLERITARGAERT